MKNEKIFKVTTTTTHERLKVKVDRTLSIATDGQISSAFSRLLCSKFQQLGDFLHSDHTILQKPIYLTQADDGLVMKLG